jgi:serine protease Do
LATPPPKAIADYTQAIEIDPNFASAYNKRGFAYLNLKEYQKAIADYEKAAQLYKQEGDTVWYQKARDTINELQQKINN